MRMENHPLKTAVEVAQRAKFIAHPYGVCPIGFAAHIKAYTVDALQKHYQTWYTPNNATIVVVGPYALDYVLPLVEQYFGSLAARDVPAHQRIADPDREGLVSFIAQESKRIENVMISVDYAVPTFIKQPEKMLAMQLLVSILSGNDERSLVKAIVKEQRLALAMDAHYACGKDDQHFTFNLVIAPNRSYAKAENFLFKKLHSYLKHGIPQKDFANAKKEMLNEFEFALDGDKFLLTVADDYIDGFSKEALENYEKLIAAVTIAEVEEMLRLVLSKPPVLVSRIYPVGKMPKQAFNKVLSK